MKVNKYLFLMVSSLSLLSACSQKPSAEDLVNNDTISQKVISKDSNSTAPPPDSSKKPALPAVPKMSSEEVSKELGLDPEVISTPTPELVDPVALTATQNPSAKPDAEAVEAMDPTSKKDCDSYKAEILKEICYNARGLSSQDAPIAK